MTTSPSLASNAANISESVENQPSPHEVEVRLQNSSRKVCSFTARLARRLRSCAAPGEYRQQTLVWNSPRRRRGTPGDKSDTALRRRSRQRGQVPLRDNRGKSRLAPLRWSERGRPQETRRWKNPDWLLQLSGPRRVY